VSQAEEAPVGIFVRIYILTVDRLLVKDAVKTITARPELADATADILLYCVHGGLSIALLLLGGLFAGLTLAYVIFRSCISCYRQAKF
jgi:hypothetical protein